MASSIKDAFKKAAAAVFTAAGDIKEPITFRSKQNSNPTYTPSSNTVTDPYRDYQNIDMIFTRYSKEEINDQTILNTDVKAQCLYDDIVDFFIPKISDTVIRTEKNNDGSESEIQWDVVHTFKDAANAVWTFQLRRP